MTTKTNTKENTKPTTKDPSMDWKNRTYCNDITNQDNTSDVLLLGWVDAIRDHGHLLFIHLRDISGIVQVVFDTEVNKEAYDLAQKLRSEYVIQITGNILKRAEDTINPNIDTGHYEVGATSITILNEAETPPFIISEKDMFGNINEETHYVDEDIRLQYRYLDLRRSSMQSNLIKRSQIFKQIRDYLYDNNFNEIETPVLTKSTPEGARDYVVPSRVHDGKFYALPQSPQLFKQLLMVSGLEKYFQIAKCFRDEDLRPNRQPEFTQLDLEASFITEDVLFNLIEGLIVNVFNSQNINLTTPFPRITYKEAMNKYGSDAPDLRIDMDLVDVSDLLKDSNYKIFNMILSKDGIIKGMVLKGQAEKLSKNVLQNEFAMKTIQKMGGKGLTWMKIENGEFLSNIVQFFKKEELERVKERMNAQDGDVLVFVADINHHQVNEVLGRFRNFIAERQELIDTSAFKPCWIVDFPIFEDKDGELSSMHHPFTSPKEPIPENADKKTLLELTANAYDIVINGEEIGGGSIRIHDTNVQKKMFELLGLTEDQIKEKFGFFTQALKYGTPPHGGLALGLDRLVSMILNTASIREVIAFPKNRVASCPMTQAPSNIDSAQLNDLNLKLKEKPEENQ